MPTTTTDPGPDEPLLTEILNSLKRIEAKLDKVVPTTAVIHPQGTMKILGQSGQ